MMSIDEKTSIDTRTVPLIMCVRSGKTSMLFRYACSLASAGLSVVYLCQRSRIEDAPPALPPGIGPDHPILQNIAMRCANIIYFSIYLVRLHHTGAFKP